MLIKRKSPKGKIVWYYRLRGQKVHHSTGRSVRWQAEEWVRARVLPRGRSPQHTPTLREYTEQFFSPGCPWIANQRALGRSFSDAKARDRRGHLVNHIRVLLGDRRLDSLRGVEIERGINGLPLANGTKNNLINTLRIVMREAVREGYLLRSPMEDVQRPGNDSRPHDAFTIEELARLFPREEGELVRIWGEPRWAVMHYLMVTTGLRVGETVALRWEDWLPEVSAILIRRAVKADRSIGPPKNGRERAAVYPSRTGELLAWWLQQTPYGEPADPICPGAGGEHVATSTMCRVMTGHGGGRKRPAHEGVLARAGIDSNGRVLTTHSLRTPYNTLMRPLLPETVLQYMMGHRSRAMTDRYDRATPAQRVQDLLAPVRGLVESVWTQK